MIANNRKKLGICHSFFTLLCLCSFALADDSAAKLATSDNALSINSFDVVFSANFNGFNVEATHRLTRLDNGNFKESLLAKNMLGKISEYSIFDISNDGQIIPLEHIKQKMFFGNRTEKQRFDWSKNSLVYSHDGESLEVKIEPGYLDVMSHKLQLRKDIANGRKNMSYTVISKGKLKQYQYRLVGHEVLKTPLGALNTVAIERVTKSESKYTKIWLASDWDHLIVRLKKMDRGEKQEMVITRGNLNGIPLTPLTVDVES